MHRNLILLFIVAWFGGSLKAEEVAVAELKTVDGRTFSKASISQAPDGSAKIVHSSGVLRVAWSVMPHDIRKHFGQDEANLSLKASNAAKNQHERNSRLMAEAKAFEETIKAFQKKDIMDIDLLAETIVKLRIKGEKHSICQGFEHLANYKWICLNVLGTPSSTQVSQWLNHPNTSSIYDDKLTWMRGSYNKTTKRIESVDYKMIPAEVRNSNTGDSTFFLNQPHYILESWDGRKIDLEKLTKQVASVN
jgi:hypothetical protein